MDLVVPAHFVVDPADPLDTYAAEQSAARTKSICSPPSQIALVYRIAATRHPEGKWPSRIRLRAVHKLSSDRPALRRIGIDLSDAREPVGRFYSRSNSIGFGIRCTALLRTGQIRAARAGEGSHRTAMGCRSGRLDLDQRSAGRPAAAQCDSRSVGVVVGGWPANHRIKMPLDQGKIERPRGSSTVVVDRLSSSMLFWRRSGPLAGPRPSREGAAGPLANRGNRGALGRRIRLAAGRCAHSFLYDLRFPRCWMGLRSISRRRSCGPQRYKTSLALIQTKAGTVRRRSSEIALRYL